MQNPNLVKSGSISGSFSALSIPGPISITGSAYAPGGSDAFDMTTVKSYSMQVYVTGSSIAGVMALQQSNNMAGWITNQSQSISAVGDYLFSVPGNASAYARLLWSGSAGSGSAITIASSVTR